MQILLESFCGVMFFLILGLVFFWMIAVAISKADTRASHVEQLDTEHQNASHARDMERQALLWDIKATPERQRGAMWAKYKELETLHAAMDDQENRAIAEAYSVIDDQTAWELENGINPYKVKDETADESKPAHRPLLGDRSARSKRLLGG